MNHPYENAPPYRLWRTAMSGRTASQIEPFPVSSCPIAATDRIMAAGSCFAQHLARHLRLNRLRLVDEERAHPMLSAATAKAHGYGIYSARYGNIYTSRQLLQLLRRARGQFVPADDSWEDHDRFFDPFRPSIQPGGFVSREELERDRQQHLAAVRRAFENMDVLVFTLGLTECWFDRTDGAVYPMCPGTVAGRFDAARHGFADLDVESVVGDLTLFIQELHEINAGARLLLTVSPVPLVATASDRHVLVSTTHSKAVLRVAAEKLSRLPGIDYFPAYEIVTCGGTGNDWFDTDRRRLREPAIAHVMSLFFRHLMPHWHAEEATTSDPGMAPDAAHRPARDIVETLCDEQHLDAPKENGPSRA